MPFSLYKFCLKRINNCFRRILNGIEILWDNVFKGGMFALIIASITWLSIFLYVVFYYLYIPSIMHNRLIHLQFQSCGSEKGICSYPQAHVQLTKRQNLLMVGQPYNIFLTLEMPESPANVNLGMFMVCAEMKDKNGILVAHACRSAMLRYRSWLLRGIMTFMYSPFYVMGWKDEAQFVHLELYTDYEDLQNHAVTDVYLEIQSQHIEVYKAKLLIQAKLSGLRYLMFYWPVFSGFFGISSNLFFISFIATISWWHLYGRHEYQFPPVVEYLSNFYPSRISYRPFTGQVEEIETHTSALETQKSPKKASVFDEESDSEPSQSFFKQGTGEELGDYFDTETDS